MNRGALEMPHRQSRTVWSVAWIAVVLAVPVAAGASPDLGTVLYGASYYHEYMPEERLEKDVELMQQAGVSVIRLG